MAKMSGMEIAVDGEKGVMKYENFNVEPGMSTWVDMPDEYRKAYFEHEKKMKEIALKRAQKENESKIEDKIREQHLRERIRDMETKIFGMDGKKPKVKDKDDKKKKKRQPLEKPNLDATRCNFIDRKFFDRKHQEVVSKLTIKKQRPKILLIADVCGWAWWNKSQYLKMYLADDFDIDTICVLGPEKAGINRGKYQLFVTYGYSYVHMLQGVPRRRRMTGITAHRKINFLKPYMELAKWNHANSLMLIEDLKKMKVKNTEMFYVPNGVDEQVFHPIRPLTTEGELIAGHVGKVCTAKGQQEFIIPAMNRAKVKSIYNMNDYRDRRPYCEMAPYYNDMDVFLCASVEDGTPNPALEAAACGRPIISNRIGNMPELIKDGYNGFLVERKVGAYVEKLEYLRKNRDHLVEMGKNARKTI
jgi:glycosyltransferase involved in cell wall biosynthesis